MKITKNAVVTIEYTLTDESGRVLDTSEGRGPLSYIQGIGSLIPGLENALEGRLKGDKLQVNLAPSEAYGDRDEALVQVIPRNQFDSAQNLEVGMQFEMETDNGGIVLTIVNLEGENVTVDANHPLAGVALNFDVAVSDVREATKEELSHGHVHGPNGHHHH